MLELMTRRIRDLFHTSSSPFALRPLAAWALLAVSPTCAADEPPTPTVLPRPDFHFQGNVGRTYLDSDPAQFPQPVRAPEGAPNIVLILLDDVGFGQFAAFGGGVPSPTIDRLAAEGLRYNRFHTTALCSPTRAALLTGRNAHSASSGVIAEAATGYDGYTGVIPKSTGAIAEVLRQNGYMTAMIGKNHNTPTWEASVAGPFDRWPNGLGFDYFYGFNGGDTSQWNPVVYENRNLVPPSNDPDYHLTPDLADHAISWARNVKTIAPDRPIFLYVAPGATHAPHHAPKEWIERFAGQFDMGWDKYRELTVERQKKLGVIPADAQLTPRPEGLPSWDSLNADQKRLYARMMEVFAGFGAHTDHEMGRIVDAVKRLPGGDNTLFIYIAGDNGASAEGGLEGSINENMALNGFSEKWQHNLEVIDELGGPKHFNHFPAAWAHAMNTPFKWTKRIASHFGGIRNPLVVSWPGKIKESGGLRTQFTHVVDIVPTLYELTGITPPTMLNGVAQKPIEGVSFAYSLNDANAKDRHTTQYFELGSKRGLYHDGWMASAMGSAPWFPRNDFVPDQQQWELYHIDEDFTQAVDLAARYPQKLRELQDLWWAEAARHNVLPLDWRTVERFNGALMGRPTLGAGKTLTYYPGQVGLPNDVSPRVLNRSWTVTADINSSGADVNGIIVTQGGMVGGYALYVRDGKPTFVYNYLAEERLMLTSQQPLPSGKVQIEVEFSYQGSPKERGKGAVITLSVKGAKVAEGRLSKTIPALISLNEGMDIGEDVGSPVDFSYKPPFRFTGEIEKVRFEMH
ncbi:arylsulfatase [Povalibacter uvarum]|uniref:Arylsulfatase n=1 Tax=Povalibacter uvarum TaxID=732238 RepID=A0A841HV18_9GAMM|nr:arylsulfatase [Povalibacter uvarum]MBB6095812.1 arylsulfatase [Povalibacter uvarum]